MLSDLIMDLLECEHDPTEREKVYRKIEKAGVDRRTADLMAGEYRKSWLADQEKAEKEIREKEANELLIKKCIEKAEELGWVVHRDEEGIEFEQSSPAGEDFCFYVRFPDIVREVKEYYDGFDPEEHVSMWVEAKNSPNNPNKDSIPSIRTLVKDADEIDEMLESLSDALTDVAESFQECDTCGLEFPEDMMHELNDSFAVCDHCFDKMTPEEIKEAQED